MTEPQREQALSAMSPEMRGLVQAVLSSGDSSWRAENQAKELAEALIRSEAEKADQVERFRTDELGYLQRESILKNQLASEKAMTKRLGSEKQTMRKAIEDAPHDPYCAVIQRPPGGCDCNCFKSRALAGPTPQPCTRCGGTRVIDQHAEMTGDGTNLAPCPECVPASQPCTACAEKDVNLNRIVSTIESMAKILGVSGPELPKAVDDAKASIDLSAVLIRDILGRFGANESEYYESGGMSLLSLIDQNADDYRLTKDALAEKRREIERLREAIKGMRHDRECASHNCKCSICGISVDDHPSFFLEEGGVDPSVCPGFRWVKDPCDCKIARALSGSPADPQGPTNERQWRVAWMNGEKSRESVVLASEEIADTCLDILTENKIHARRKQFSDDLGKTWSDAKLTNASQLLRDAQEQVRPVIMAETGVCPKCKRESVFCRCSAPVEPAQAEPPTEETSR